MRIVGWLFSILLVAICVWVALVPTRARLEVRTIYGHIDITLTPADWKVGR